MADVSISYKGNEIASMNATGVKTLLTSSAFCEDDITVTYTKPAAPTPTLTTVSFYCYGDVYYTDSNNIAQHATPTELFSATVPSKSLIAAFSYMNRTSTHTNCSLIDSKTMGAKVTYKYGDVIQAD